jgi:hypothetical protein
VSSFIFLFCGEKIKKQEIMNKLEIKIREALPHLKELRNGAIIYKPHWNTFSQKYDEGVFDEIEYRYGQYFEYGEQLPYFELDSDWYVGYPIMLNDVILYLKMNEGEVRDTTDEGLIAFYKDLRVTYWDLSSVYLSEQGDDLVEFLGNL